MPMFTPLRVSRSHIFRRRAAALTAGALLSTLSSAVVHAQSAASPSARKSPLTSRGWSTRLGGEPLVPTEIKGLDLCRDAGASPNVTALRDKGFQFVITQAWGGRSRNPYAGSQIRAARQAGMRTAAFCYLNFDANSGAYQVDQALAALGGEAGHIGFLALDVENSPNMQGISTPAERVRVIEDALDEVRRVGLQPVIYTKGSSPYADQRYWNILTGDTSRFRDVPLWDTQNDHTGSLSTNWRPYGGWSGRAGKQYAIETSVAGVSVDKDVFDASAFSAGNPNYAATPMIGIVPVVTRDGGTVHIALAVVNTGTLDAKSVFLTSATLALKDASTASDAVAATGLPETVGNVGVGQIERRSLDFALPVVVSGQSAVLTVRGTYDGGTWAASVNVEL